MHRVSRNVQSAYYKWFADEIPQSCKERPRVGGRERTFERSELIDSFEARSLVLVVGPERDAEERAVRLDGADEVLVLGSTQPLHLAVDQLNVEVGELDVVAVRTFQATARQTDARLTASFP